MNSTLTTLWVDEGQLIQTAPTVKNEVKAEIVSYYKENGLESLAKEAGILDPNGELAICRNQKAKTTTTVRPLLAMPMMSATTATTNRISPFKTEPAILPRTVQVATSPMILSSPQRNSVGGQLLGSSPRTPQAILSPLADGSGNWTAKRLHDYSDSDYGDSKRSKKNEKGGKGLRHFSMKVCEKVQKKGTTSYNEVADELVAEFSDPVRSMSPTEHGSDSQAYDQKNIRRRVYDALNVLMAMSIISKEKKEIRWLGLPTNSAQECQNLEAEKQKRLDRIALKSQQLQELIIQQVAFKGLVHRNRQQEKIHGSPMQNSMIQLPFIIVNTSKKTTIDCSISSDKTEYLFNFDNTFEIHDDIEVLKRMGMSLSLEKGTCSSGDLDKARTMVPKALESYVIQMAKEGGLQANNKSGNAGAGPSTLRSGCSSSSALLANTNLIVKTTSSPALAAGSADTLDSDSMQRAPSRQSSVTSFSDNMPSQPDSATEDDFSDSDSDHSSNIDIN